MAELSVANTILQQLGGRRFLAMTGAKNLQASAYALTMKLPSNMTKGRATHFRITLTGDDLYHLQALRVRGYGPEHSVAEEGGIYCDMLRERFEAITGLRTSL